MLRRAVCGLLALCSLQAAASSQEGRWLVQFRTRSFDLTEFRAANLRRDATAIARIVRELERRVRVDQSDFVATIDKLGGRITEQFWITNACALRLDASKIEGVRALPGVLRVERDVVFKQLNHKSTNLVNHNSDNLNARGFRGANVGIAILDTGQDTQMGTSGRNHRCYYPDGDLAKKSRLLLNRQIGLRPAEDRNGHGTAVAAVAAAGDWGTPKADHGHAPHANILGYAIEDLIFGGAYASTVTKAWQTVAADAVKYRIVAANNSYSGSPDPLQTTQQALDSCALNANVLICVGCGNHRASTQVSQAAVNGLAVGSVRGDAHTMASSSSRGPIFGDNARFYPDIVGCGVDIFAPRVDDEGIDSRVSGTSISSPQVCGAAALLRSAVPSLTAIETKAILLASAVDISAKNTTPPFNTRNAYGMGLLRDDYALAIAQQSAARGTATVTTTTPTWSKVILCKKGESYRAAISWMRTVLTSRNWSNLDFEVRHGTTLVHSSKTTRNLYELVTWKAQQTGAYTLRVLSPRLEGNTQSFAWATMSVPAPPAAGDFTSFGAGCRGTGKGGEVLPATYRKQMGNIANSLPFCTKNLRYQQVFLSSEIAPSSATFVGLSVRQDDLVPPRGTGTQQLKIILGYSTYGPSSLTNDFRKNVITGTAVTVYDGKVQLPSLSGRNSDPKKFTLNLKFTKPFAFVKRTGQNLIMEVVNTSQASVSLHFDAARGSSVNAARLFAFGPSATTGSLALNYGLVIRFDTQGRGAGNVPRFAVRDMPQSNSILNFDLSEAPATSPTLLLLGASRTSWNGLALPFDLTPLGAPSCSLLAGADFVGVTTTNALGAARITLPLPNNRALIGTRFHGQFAIHDRVTNPLGWIVSNGGTILLGGQR